jgi:hypothetical protein
MADENISDSSYIQKDLMDFEQELINAPELPKEQIRVTDKAKALSLIKKGILAYLKKGHSVREVYERFNEKFPAYRITEDEVKKYVRKVTKKKTTTTVKNNSNTSGNRHEKIYLVNTFNDKEDIKTLGGKYDPDQKKWYIPEDEDIEKFEKWLPPKD